MDIEMEWMEWLAVVDSFDPETKKVFNECDKLEEELEKNVWHPRNNKRVIRHGWHGESSRNPRTRRRTPRIKDCPARGS